MFQGHKLYNAFSLTIKMLGHSLHRVHIWDVKCMTAILKATKRQYGKVYAAIRAAIRAVQLSPF